MRSSDRGKMEVIWRGAVKIWINKYPGEDGSYYAEGHRLTGIDVRQWADSDTLQFGEPVSANIM